jgi:hypothetical protein
MAGVTYGKSGKRVFVAKAKGKVVSSKSAEDVVREIKASQKVEEEDYREKSLALHGLICARCGREFDASNRHLLTVHHKDGNHQNNPPDGSNWENLCIYCHEDIHSRELLGDYFDGNSADDQRPVVYRDPDVEKQAGIFAAKLKEAFEKRKK